MQRASGRGELAVKSRDHGTHIKRLHQAGCAKILLPRTHNENLEAVLINTAGGLTGGDRVQWHIDCASNTRLVVTTQACERVYRALDGSAQVKTRIKVEENAHLWWLPQETILFEGARLERHLDVQLAKNARLTAVEVVLLGRQAMNEEARDVRLDDQWRISRDNQVFHAEATRLTGAKTERDALCALGNHPAFATLVHIAPDAEEGAHKIPAELRKSSHVGVSALPGRMIVRAIAPSGLAMRRLIAPLLNQLSPTGALPRVWSL